MAVAGYSCVRLIHDFLRLAHSGLGLWDMVLRRAPSKAPQTSVCTNGHGNISHRRLLIPRSVNSPFNAWTRFQEEVRSHSPILAIGGFIGLLDLAVEQAPRRRTGLDGLQEGVHACAAEHRMGRLSRREDHPAPRLLVRIARSVTDILSR